MLRIIAVRQMAANGLGALLRRQRFDHSCAISIWSYVLAGYQQVFQHFAYTNSIWKGRDYVHETHGNTWYSNRNVSRNTTTVNCIITWPCRVWADVTSFLPQHPCQALAPFQWDLLAHWGQMKRIPFSEVRRFLVNMFHCVRIRRALWGAIPVKGHHMT